MTESGEETKMFAQLRVVALRCDRQEMDSLAWREITPRGVGDVLLHIPIYLAFSGNHWAAWWLTG